MLGAHLQRKMQQQTRQQVRSMHPTFGSDDALDVGEFVADGWHASVFLCINLAVK